MDNITDSSGFKWRGDLQSLQSVPVEPSEEWVLPDVPLTILSSTKTLGWVLGQELRTEPEKSNTVSVIEAVTHSFLEECIHSNAFPTRSHYC